MALEKSDILTRCCVCKAIKIGGEWMKREDNPNLYERFIDKYSQEGKGISDTYCPEDYKKFIEEIDKLEKEGFYGKYKVKS